MIAFADGLKARMSIVVLLMISLPVLYGVVQSLRAFWERATIEQSFVESLAELTSIELQALTAQGVSPESLAEQVATQLRENGVATELLQIVISDHQGIRLSAWTGAEVSGDAYERKTDFDAGEPRLSVSLTVHYDRWSWLDRPLAIGVLVPILMVSLFMIAMWLAFDFLVARHVRNLAACVDDYRATGQLGSQVASPSIPSEFRVLFGSFKAMAEEAHEREARLGTALQASEDTLRELHHRVRNNLQVILSMIAVRQRRAVSNDVRSELASVARRMHAIVLAHRDPIIDIADGQANAARYIMSVFTQFRELPGTSDLQVVNSSTAAQHVSIDQLVPLGLFLTEWLEQPQIKRISKAVLNSDRHGLHLNCEIETTAPLSDELPLNQRLLLEQCCLQISIHPLGSDRMAFELGPRPDSEQ